MTMVSSEASITETSSRMRESGESEVTVISTAAGEPRELGIVTADDIVRQVVALGLDPAILTAGDVASLHRPALPR